MGSWTEEASEDRPVSAHAVVEPVGDSGDGGRRGMSFLCNFFVRELCRPQELRDMPALGNSVEFSNGHEIAEEVAYFNVSFDCSKRREKFFMAYGWVLHTDITVSD